MRSNENNHMTQLFPSINLKDTEINKFLWQISQKRMKMYIHELYRPQDILVQSPSFLEVNFI